MKSTALLILGVALLLCAAPAQAGNHGNRVAARFSRSMPWHGPYYHTAYGHPLGLVVPPTANTQVKMAWGVSQNELHPIYHQFHRAYPGGFDPSTQMFMPTPAIPSHTDQFGVYYIRGPW